MIEIHPDLSSVKDIWLKGLSIEAGIDGFMKDKKGLNRICLLPENRIYVSGLNGVKYCGKWNKKFTLK